MVSLSALLHDTVSRVPMMNVIPGGSVWKVTRWELPPAATNWNEQSLLVGMGEIRKGELNPELLTGSTWAADRDSQHFLLLALSPNTIICHLGKKECLERKFTFSDKPSSMNDTVRALLGWETDRLYVGRKLLCGNSFVTDIKLREISGSYAG